MTDKPENEPLQSAPTQAPATDVLPDHLFSRMRTMLAGSINNLPTPLVLILMASLLAVVLTGLTIKFSVKAPSDPFMPQRLSANSAATALDPARLEGNWTATNNGITMTLRLKGASFEWVAKQPDSEFERVFSRGNFRTVGNVLILGAREDMGRPENTPEYAMTFLPMAMKNINVAAEENGRLMVWVLPQSERNRLPADIRSYFPAEAEKPLTWVRM